MFDNSNIQGTNPVSACVVFKKARPVKEYRHYNIKSCRTRRLRLHARSVKDATLDCLTRAPLYRNSFDDGKGQLHAAVKSLQKIGLDGKIAIIGIAKRLEEIYFPNDPIPLYIDKNSETLKLIQQLRDEAHRFGLSFHRKKRSQSQIASELDSIAGIGPATKKKLLAHFKSIKRIKEADEEEIEQLIGSSKAKLINEWKNKTNTQEMGNEN